MGTHPPPSDPSGEPLLTRKLVFWKQGFTVDDGELRHYDDPANNAFLEAVNRGYIQLPFLLCCMPLILHLFRVAPPELAEQDQEIDLQIVDNKGQDYVPPPSVLKPFSGAGHSLGG